MNLFRIFKKINKLFFYENKKRPIFVLLVIMASGLLDAIGVASIMPFLYIVLNPNKIHDIDILYYLFSTLNFSNETIFLGFLGFIVFGILVFSLFIRAVALFVATKFSLDSEVQIAHRLMSEYLRKDYLWFVNENSVDLTKKSLAEVINVCDNGVLTYLQLITHTSILFFMCVFLFFINPLITITSVIAICFLYFLIYNIFSENVKNFGKGRYSSNQERYLILSEAVSNPRELKLYNSVESYKKRFVRASKVYAECNLKAQMYAGLPRFIIEFLAFGCLLLISIYILFFTDTYLETLPLIAVFALSAYRALPAVQQIYGSVIMLSFVEASVDEVLADLEAPSAGRTLVEESDSTDGALHFSDGSLSFKNVVFKYPSKSVNALENVSLEIECGQHIGIVGSSGSGKSTFADICSGLLIPESGSVCMSNLRLTNQAQREWFARIGYVSQSVKLIDGSIKDNIAFGLIGEKVDEARVQRCAITALAHDFIIESLPFGYDTEIGENGLKLSGGQRQRIGIARALYKDPDILIVDEGTSALDSALEIKVIDELQKCFSKKTIIMISHNLTSLKNCDTIYYFEQGSVIESGTFNELIYKSEKFKKLIMK